MIHFFIGKGGVGKTTTSALTALKLAGKGHQTLLVSMDPAHNQRDIFKQNFSEKPKEVIDGLSVKEVDTDFWIKTYLKDAESQLKKAYGYQSAFNIQNYYNILKYSPGLEEYALLLAFENILQTASDKDDIFFDMPPTALTMRFFSLPFITLIWLEELLKLRKHIYAKKEIVSKIKFAKKEMEQDKVKSRLISMVDNYTRLRDHFTSNAISVNLVLNNDSFSLSESIRIRQKLAGIGIAVSQVLINKVANDSFSNGVKKEFNGYPLIGFPLCSHALCGLNSLQNYLKNNSFSELN